MGRASYLGLFFEGRGEKGGEGGLSEGGKKSGGWRLEEERRSVKREGKWLCVVTEGGGGSRGGLSVTFRYEAAAHPPSSSARLPFFVLKPASRTASLEVKCSLISLLIKLL